MELVKSSSSTRQGWHKRPDLGGFCALAAGRLDPLFPPCHRLEVGPSLGCRISFNFG